MITTPIQNIYGVAQLSREICTLLESSFRQVWVMGEISSLAQSARRHLYFTLKEDTAALRCAFFKQRRAPSNCQPVNGMQVLLCGQVSLYQDRGYMQLIVSYMEETGEGALRRKFEDLKQKLQEEGLFDAQSKQPIPTIPHTISVITSAQGAAIYDIRATLKRRFPGVRLLLYPTSVQGSNAVCDIISMIELANLHHTGQVIILARGGGSLEDLQAFNDEDLARAIFASKLPLISGIGHENDITIADLTADVRAATPTAAAEMSCLHRDELSLQFNTASDQIRSSLTTKIRDAQQKLDYLTRKLPFSLHQLIPLRQKLNQINNRLHITNIIAEKHSQLMKITSILKESSPLIRLNRQQQELQTYINGLSYSMFTILAYQQKLLATLSAKISVISPYKTLERGYSILQANGRVIMDTDSVDSGDKLCATLSKGTLNLIIESKE